MTRITVGNKPPQPEGGWSTQIEHLQDAVVVPAETRSFHQPTGVLRADGSYCEAAALWRKRQELTTRPEPPQGDVDHLPGRWLWGGLHWRHFGHFVVESTSRLWGLDRLETPVQGVLFVPKSPKYGDEVIGYQVPFFDLAGVQPKILLRPTRVDELVVPGQGFGIGDIAHGTAPFRDYFHTSFARDIQPDGPEKLYISRSQIGPTRGALVCEAKFESYLQDHGYVPFHPQKHDVATQVARYKAARQAIASEGSAIHMFALVARAHQRLAFVVRRKSPATKYITWHAATFMGADPLVIHENTGAWKPEGYDKPRFIRSEPDFPRIQKILQEKGFIGDGPAWPALTEAEVSADLNSAKRPDLVYNRVIPKNAPAA